MPVVTRSQSRALAKQVYVPNDNIAVYKERKESFTANMKKIYAEWGDAKSTKDQIIPATKTFEKLNAEFEYLFDNCKDYNKQNPHLWNNFTVVVYGKIKEFRNQYISTIGWPVVNKDIVNKLMAEMDKCSIMINKCIMQINKNDMLSDKFRIELIAAQNEISKAQVKNRATKQMALRTSPRKNIKRIDYSQFY